MRGIVLRKLLLATSLTLAPWEPSQAEIYKCVGADGKPLFTSDRAQCPGAERHELTGKFQTVPNASSSPERQRPARRRGYTIEHAAGNETLWRGKKLRAEAELRDLANRIAYLNQAVKWCNRGHDLYTEDETGIRHAYDCRKVDNEYQQLEAHRAELRLYLDEGLEEECRRAGCLPGWIR